MAKKFTQKKEKRVKPKKAPPKKIPKEKMAAYLETLEKEESGQAQTPQTETETTPKGEETPIEQ
ncbi:MAG: hypothetical protein HY428_00630, partial [Candidatus Levybacteria bacterium]|nr:hypothetical protein [Candidatus Levybacteria bacterium]